jgi:hypothetical protein
MGVYATLKSAVRKGRPSIRWAAFLFAHDRLTNPRQWQTKGEHSKAHRFLPVTLIGIIDLRLRCANFLVLKNLQIYKTTSS